MSQEYTASKGGPLVTASNPQHDDAQKWGLTTPSPILTPTNTASATPVDRAVGNNMPVLILMQPHTSLLTRNYTYSRVNSGNRSPMTLPRLTRLELQIMEALWTRGACSVREIQETFPSRNRPAYTTIQTTVYRLETKKALRVSKRIGNANIFESAISRDQAQGRLVDELLILFGGRARPVMAHLIETGKLTLDDLNDAEQTLRSLARKDKTS
jgi:BlaI family transcriptional regulator, penicillinase repressor